ncbi:MAG: sucrase ferredoxin [Cyanothece sp. SIO1E1]|nr:sucrase ferredoxin [Cyanothece sp. SIO1E1]
MIMEKFFCAHLSREAGEDIVGCAPDYQTYILIECTGPWAPKAFESKGVPDNLRALVAEMSCAQMPVRFLLVEPERQQTDSDIRVMVFRKQMGLSNGYCKWDCRVADITHVAPLVKRYLTSHTLGSDWVESRTRDLLVCTHGSHDQCCARYGYPFYRQALKILSESDMGSVRVWQVSHIGGHRFAPTLIDLPTGRYYGALDPVSFKSILQRTGSVDCYRSIYRGWGILPKPIQVMERELILRHGWEWLDYKVTWQMIEQDPKKLPLQVKLTGVSPEAQQLIYVADIVEDETKTLNLIGSCKSQQASRFVKFAVHNLCLFKEPVPLSMPKYRAPQSTLTAPRSSAEVV